MAPSSCQNSYKKFTIFNSFVEPSFNIDFSGLKIFLSQKPAINKALAPKSASSPDSNLLFALALSFPKKLFEQFIQIYINMVKNKAQVLVLPVSALSKCKE